MTRQAVTKHLGILERANLVATISAGARNCIFSILFRFRRLPTAGSANTSAGVCERSAI